MDQATEDRIKIIVSDHVDDMKLVGREFCIERHKGVTSLEQKVKVLDARLWGLIVLALVQLGGIVAVLMK